MLLVTMTKQFENEANLKDFVAAAKKCESAKVRGVKECYEHCYGKLKVKVAVVESSGCCSII